MSPEVETVLVIDDDAAVRAALKFALEVDGFRVRVYDSAAAFLADGSLPVRACLVIDYRMPDIDGLELVELLRARQVALPAILISGRVDDQLRRRAARHGVSLVLEKPLLDGALLEGIRAALRLAPASAA